MTPKDFRNLIRNQLMPPPPEYERTPCPGCGNDQCPGCNPRRQEQYDPPPDSHRYAENPPL